jgi:uncharacterized membrane protein YphA (DoxX/SURF4 family)
MNGVAVGLTMLHVATGAFFTITGARKVFMPEVRDKVRGLLASHGVPAPAHWAVMGGELLGGLGLLTGTLTQAAAAGLLVIMSGAYTLDTWPAVKAKQTAPRSLSKLCSNALCTPEAQLIVCLMTLAFTGAGPVSLDALLGLWS